MYICTTCIIICILQDLRGSYIYVVSKAQPAHVIFCLKPVRSASPKNILCTIPGHAIPPYQSCVVSK